jgi:hypothetical protein
MGGGNFTFANVSHWSTLHHWSARRVHNNGREKTSGSISIYLFIYLFIRSFISLLKFLNEREIKVESMYIYVCVVTE